MKNSRKIYSSLQNRLTRKKKIDILVFKNFIYLTNLIFANLKIENLISFIKMPK